MTIGSDWEGILLRHLMLEYDRHCAGRSSSQSHSAVHSTMRVKLPAAPKTDWSQRNPKSSESLAARMCSECASILAAVQSQIATIHGRQLRLTANAK